MALDLQGLSMLNDTELKIKDALSTLHNLLIRNVIKGTYTCEQQRQVTHLIESLEDVFMLSVGRRLIKESNKKNE